MTLEEKEMEKLSEMLSGNFGPVEWIDCAYLSRIAEKHGWTAKFEAEKIEIENDKPYRCYQATGRWILTGMSKTI